MSSQLFLHVYATKDRSRGWGAAGAPPQAAGLRTHPCVQRGAGWPHAVQCSQRAVRAAASRQEQPPPSGFELITNLLTPQAPDPQVTGSAQEQQASQTVVAAAATAWEPLAASAQPQPPAGRQPRPSQHQPVAQPPPPAPAAQHQPSVSQHQTPPQHQQQHVGANSYATDSRGPTRASVSELLAGVPLEQMLQRKQVERQLQCQQQQLNGSSSDDAWEDVDEVQLPAAMSSTRNGSSDGSSVGASTAMSPPPAATSALDGSVNNSSMTSSSNSSSKSCLGEGGSSQQAGRSTVTSPEAAIALAAYEDAIAYRRMVPVFFKLKHAAEPGQRLRVVGGHKSLGRWALHKAPELQRGKGDVWQATIKLPAGSVSEYKYALLDASGNVLALQAGNNGVVAVRMADQRLEVADSWAGESGGGQVVAEGETGLAWRATRETRLMAWANDMFQQLAMMRQDLRQAHMEVVGAQEEAREARMEALRYQSQLFKKQVRLAEVETAHALDKSRLVEALSMNQMLKEQLMETTASLNEAIETAAELLAEREEEEVEEEEKAKEEEEEQDPSRDGRAHGR